MTVKTKAEWDHKPKIKAMFKSVAVQRPLESERMSESHYHKYKDYDYFYDVWSNIHYGYVGLSVGFSEDYLLLGASLEQIRSSLKAKPDPIDDVTAIKIGYALYKQFGKYAEQLTVQAILNALHNMPKNAFPVSKNDHWCWHENNPKKIKKS